MTTALEALVFAVALFMCAAGALVGALALWWFARSVTALANATLNVAQVSAMSPADEVPPAAEDEPEAQTRLARARMDVDPEALLAAARAATRDEKVLEINTNIGLEETEPIPGGGSGVYRRGR